MLHDPVKQSLLKANIVACFLTFDPFVTKDLFALGEELFVEQGFFDEVVIVCRR